ncbi:MAG: insulinase family protein [Planctomycetota bacterium]
MKERLVTSHSAAAVKAALDGELLRGRRWPGGFEYSLLYRDAVPIVSLVIGVRTGSRHESTQQRGAAHLVARWVIRQEWGGCEVREHLAARGAGCRIHVEPDATYFEISSPSREVSEVLAVMRRALFEIEPEPGPSLEEERTVALHASQERSDPLGLAARVPLELFGHVGYGRPALANGSDLETLDPQAVLDFHREGYRPGRAFLSLVGEVAGDIESWLSEWDEDSQPPRPSSLETGRAPSFEPIVLRGPTSFPRWWLARALPGSQSLEAPALDVLVECLTGRSQSCLVRELSQVEGALEPIRSLHAVHRDASFWLLDGPFEGSGIGAFLDKIDDVFGDVSRDGLKSEEIERAKERIERRLGRALKHGRDVAFALARCLAIGGGEAAEFRAVDVERATGVAATHLVGPRRAVGALVPEAFDDSDLEWGHRRGESDLARRRAGGLSMHALPSRPRTDCAVGVLVGGGAAIDPRDLGGLARLTAELCLAGRANESRAHLHESIEKIGADLRVETLPDSVLFQIVGPREQRSKLIELLGSVVVSPALQESELAALKQRLATETLDRSSDPRRVIRGELAKTLFGTDRGYGQPPEGTQASLARLGLEEVRDCYEQTYHRANIQAVVVGGFEPRVCLDELEQALRYVPIGEKWTPPSPRPRSSKEVQRIGWGTGPTATVGLTFAQRVSLLEIHARGTLLAGCLGSAVPARLGYLQRRHPSIRRIEGRWISLRGVGLLEVLAEVEIPFAEECASALSEECSRLIESPLSAEEVDRARALVRTAFLSRTETVAGENRLALDWLRLGFELERFERFLDEIDRTTGDDLVGMAERVIVDGSAASVVLVPEGDS